MAKKAHAIKLPTTRTLFYGSGALSSLVWTGGKKINLMRDLATVNRHNVAHTNSKGVPYVVRAAITMQPAVAQNIGSGAEDQAQIFSDDVNMVQVAEIHTIPNTWVTRNALVKTHAARENMFKQQGVLKRERGAYSRTLRPTLSASPDTFLTPKKGSTVGGLNYDAGTWDYTSLKADDGDMSHLPIVGDAGLLSLYLDSRRQIDPDSNSEDDSENQPVDSNILRQLLSPTLGISSKDDDVTALARDEQDNPPYSVDNNGDHSDLVLAGRQFIGPSAGFTSTEVYDIPLGMFEFGGINAFTDNRSGEVTTGFTIRVDVLGMYEM